MSDDLKPMIKRLEKYPKTVLAQYIAMTAGFLAWAGMKEPWGHLEGLTHDVKVDEVNALIDKHKNFNLKTIERIVKREKSGRRLNKLDEAFVIKYSNLSKRIEKKLRELKQ